MPLDQSRNPGEGSAQRTGRSLRLGFVISAIHVIIIIIIIITIVFGLLCHKTNSDFYFMVIMIFIVQASRAASAQVRQSVFSLFVIVEFFSHLF